MEGANDVSQCAVEMKKARDAHMRMLPAFIVAGMLVLGMTGLSLVQGKLVLTGLGDPQALLVLRNILLFLALLLGGIGMIVTLFVSDGTRRPIAMLIRAAKRLAEGGPLKKPAVPSGGESGISGGSFNQMIKNLREVTVSKSCVDNILNSMIDTLVVLNPVATILMVNKATCDLLGYKEDELIGRPVDTILAAAGETGGEVSHKEPWLKKLFEEGSIRNYETTYRTKAGEAIPVSFTGSVMWGGNGKLDGIVGVARDMREVKKLMRKEKELAASVAKAAGDDRRKTEELQRAYQELKTTQLQLIQAVKLESVGRLAAGVAHEVKNPLTTILLGTQYLSKHVESENANVTGTLNDINAAVRRADTVVKGLLDFATPRQLVLKQESLNSVVERSLELVKNELMKFHVVAVKELSPVLPLVSLDRSKMEQVFVNLFMNAIQAMPKGGKVTVRTFSKQLSETHLDAGDRRRGPFSVGETAILVEVDDTGSGVALNQLTKIFDPFFTTKAAGQGTGLGLAVTKSIIELHGSTINIRNRNGGGVRVVMMFKPDGRRAHSGKEAHLGR